MKKLTLIVSLIFAITAFGQKVDDKIKLFENDLIYWDKSKIKKWTLAERMKFYEVNAVSIAVIKDYKVEWVKAYGEADSNKKRPATTQTLFQAASISKTINSLGVLRLVEEGKLDLDVDINTYLKEWKFPYDSTSKGKKITVANLLNHTAGLSVHGFSGYEKGAPLPTITEILDGVKPANSHPVRSVMEPGLKFQYSGGGTEITQLIIENITGEKYEDYILKNVLSRLGMINSFFTQPPGAEKENILATGYNSDQEVKGKFHVYPEKAAAGLWTNPTDLVKYIIDTQLSLEGKSNKIVSKETAVKRLENNFGVFLSDFKGVKYFGHSGGNEGFVCNYIGSVENGDGIVVMTNGRSSMLIDEIFCCIASMNNWKNFPLDPKKESIALTIRKECKKNIDTGLELYQKLKKEQANVYNFSDENELNQLGYELLNEAKMEQAIKVFSLNITEFPKSSNVYDSRGEAYFNKKEYLLSKNDYTKVLELDSTNQNAKEMISKIEELLKK